MTDTIEGPLYETCVLCGLEFDVLSLPLTDHLQTHGVDLDDYIQERWRDYRSIDPRVVREKLMRHAQHMAQGVDCDC